MLVKTAKQDSHFSKSKRLTLYRGLVPFFTFFDTIGLIADFEEHFEAPSSIPIKDKGSQIMLSIISASLCGIAHFSTIATFATDVWIKSLSGILQMEINVRLPFKWQYFLERDSLFSSQ